MSSSYNFYKEHVFKWIDQAKDYPTKAILLVSLRVFKEQEKRIEIQKGRLEGEIWSPRSWQNNDLLND